MTGDAFNAVLHWLNIHPNLAGLVTFLISASESIAIIGTIVPGSVTMTAVGTLAGAGVIPFWTTISWAIAGALMGDNFSYWIGHHFKDRLATLWPFRLYPQLLLTGKKFIARHGMKSVLIGRFIGPVRALVPIVAGMLGMSPWRYVIISIVASCLWAPLYMLPGILLGEASLELPPDVAVHAILTFVLSGLLFLLCLWFVYRFFLLISNHVNWLLNRIWFNLKNSRHFSLITIILKHHNPQNTHGQLSLLFYIILAGLILLNLSTFLMVTPPDHITTNMVFFHLFRSLRNPNVDPYLLDITLLGEKRILIVVMLVMVAWFVYLKRLRSALHLFAALGVTVTTVLLLKHAVHGIRPWGVFQNQETYSFPSGHTTLSTVFYVSIALWLSANSSSRRRKFFVGIALALSLLIALSRLYLGAHWFTDVVSGLLLSSIILMVIALSYNRVKERHVPVRLSVFVLISTFIITYGTFYSRNFDDMLKNSTPIDWPRSAITLDSWWNQKNNSAPLYRIGRLGLAAEFFNVQWVGDLDTLKRILLAEGWEVPTPENWIAALHRIADISSEQHLPLVAPLYLDKAPALVLIKHSEENKGLIVLRLWASTKYLKKTNIPVWLGSVGFVPRTYSWLIHYKHTPNFILSPEVLFTSLPSEIDIKQESIAVPVKHKNRIEQKPLILMKPQNLI